MMIMPVSIYLSPAQGTLLGFGLALHKLPLVLL